MKYQQITVDFVNMVFTACSYLALAGAVWIFLRLIQACFWLPRHLKRQNHVQRMLQDKVFIHFLFVLLNSFSKMLIHYILLIYIQNIYRMINLKLIIKWKNFEYLYSKSPWNNYLYLFFTLNIHIFH